MALSVKTREHIRRWAALAGPKWGALLGGAAALKNMAKKERRSEKPNGSYSAVRVFVRIFPNKSIVPFIIV